MSDSQTSFATLGSPIGTITQITGSVVVKSIDGNERVVQVGDPIFFGETVETGTGGSATIKFIDGSEVVIGGDSNVLLNDEVYSPDDVDGLAQDSSSDTEALQQAIADGADPTLIQDAPAAGEETVTDQQQRVDVTVERNEEGSLPNFGFDTGLDSSLPSYGYDTNNSFSTLSSTTQTSSSSSRTADNTADIDNNLTVSVSASDQTTNASEASSVSVTLSGVDNDAAQISVVFSDGSSSITTNAVQDGAGNWTVPDTDISSLNDGTVSVTTTVTDSTGNTATATDTLDLDTSADADDNFSVAVAESDAVTNADEADSVSVTLSGVDADAQTVAVTFSDSDDSTADVVVNATQNDDGTWSVADADLSTLNDGNIIVTATVTDDAGNTSTTTDTLDLDTSADAGVVTVNAITEDDVINAAESESTISVSGTAIGGDVTVGDVVTMKINGTDYSTTIDDVAGNWTVDVAGSDLAEDTAFSVDVVSSDAAGNIVTSTGISTHTVDTKAFGQIDIDRITSDSIINSDESADGNLVSITGSVGNDAKPGDTITVSIDGVEIGRGVVSSEQNDDGKYLYSVDVLGSDLANTTLANPEVVVTVTGEDEVGNSFSADNTEFYKVDQFADSDIFLSEESGDYVVNLDESGSLTVGGWLEEGGSVTSITITDSEGASITYAENVSISDDGGFAYFETNVDVSSLADGDLSVVVGVVDAVGNTGFSEAEVINKDTSVSDLTSDITDATNSGSNDDTITNNATPTIAGQTEPGASVTITYTDASGVEQTTDAVTADTDGNYSITIPTALGEGSNDLSVKAVDVAGNDTTTTQNVTVDTTAAGAPGVTITEDANNDGLISAAELDGDVNVTISLTGTNAVEGDTLTVNGTDIELTAAQITAGEVLTTVAAPEEGETLTVSATITDAAGNTSAPGTDSATVDTTAAGAPGVTITEDA
ncbi:retention module-containing protein, partial [Marinomonas arenicola]